MPILATYTVRCSLLRSSHCSRRAITLPSCLPDSANTMADTTKMLLVFCDGTGMDGTLADSSNPGKCLPQFLLPQATNLYIQVATQYVTNVLRLCEYRPIDYLNHNTYPCCSSRRQKSFRVSEPAMIACNIFSSPCRSGRRQIVFYQSGVGTQADFDGKNIDNPLSRWCPLIFPDAQMSHPRTQRRSVLPWVRCILY